MPTADQLKELAHQPKHPITEAFLQRAERATIREGKQFAGPMNWVVFNLPGDRQRGWWVWLAHLKSAWEIMNQRERPPMTQDAADALRIEMDDGFSGQCVLNSTAALVEVVRRFEIPKQFLFEVLHGADLACRFPQPQTFADLTPTLAKLGGGAACGAAKILRATPGFEVPAIRLGQALLMTTWLVHLDRDLMHKQYRFPLDDFHDSGLPPNELSRPGSPKGIEYFVRQQGQRIEQFFQEARAIVDHLDFDGVRTVKAIVGTAWECVVQVMLEPRKILGMTSLSQRFPHLASDRWKFYLGLEPAQPFFANGTSNHAH